jgi:hypothetical protein
VIGAPQLFIAGDQFVLAYPRTFHCPNCNEMINESATKCRLCSLPIDPGVAELIAGRQQKVNEACSDASFLRRTAMAMYVFLAFAFVFPFTYWGFLITFWTGLVLEIRWQVKFGELITNDPDYAKARRSKNISLLLLLTGLPLGILTNPFLADVINMFWPGTFDNF